MNFTKILAEYRHGRRAVVLEMSSGFSETGNYVVLTSTRFFSESDAKAYYETEAKKRIKKET